MASASASSSHEIFMNLRAAPTLPASHDELRIDLDPTLTADPCHMPQVAKAQTTLRLPPDYYQGYTHVYASRIPEGVTVGQRGLPNAFIDACFTAYSYHLPLLLSPDMVWMAIITSLSSLLAAHAATLRNALVKVSGKTLCVVVPAALTRLEDAVIPWSDILFTFGELVASCMQAGVAERMMPEFSTTNSVSLAHANVVLMATTQAFFEFKAIPRCGIPAVVLQGTAADWSRLQEKTQALRDIVPATELTAGIAKSLDAWLTTLDGTLGQLAASAQGTPDVAFWRRMFSHYTPNLSRTEACSGWLLDLFVVDRAKRIIDHAKVRSSGGSVSFKDLPDMLARAFFQMHTVDGRRREFRMHSGCMDWCMTSAGIVMPVFGHILSERTSFRSPLLAAASSLAEDSLAPSGASTDKFTSSVCKDTNRLEPLFKPTPTLMIRPSEAMPEQAPKPMAGSKRGFSDAGFDAAAST